MSGQPNENLLASARQAIKRGDNDTARHLLRAASRKQPANYLIWLWLAGLAPSPEEALSYIQQAETLKPGDPTVAKARAWAESRMPAQDIIAPTPLSPQTQSRPRLESTAKREAAGRPPKRRRRLPLVTAAMLLVLILGVAALWFTSPIWTAWLDELQPDGELVAVSTPAIVVQSVPEETSPAPTVTSSPEPAAQITPATPLPTPNLPAKGIVAAAAESRPTWTVTPIPTDTPTPTPTFAPTFVAADQGTGQVLQPPGLGPNERWIDISLSSQKLVAYEGSIPVFETLVSTGKAQYPTVTGQFRIWLRFESQDMDGYRLGYDYYLKGVPYVQYFYQDYALHGTYWHSNFGYPMSHGCVNLSPADAAWLYDFADYGTLVNVHP